MSEFFVGQKVVYIGGEKFKRHEAENSTGLRNDLVYTLRWIGSSDFCNDGVYITLAAVRLNGYVRTFSGAYAMYNDWPIAARVFRPLDSKAIELFRQIARDVTEGKKVRINA